MVKNFIIHGNQIVIPLSPSDKIYNRESQNHGIVIPNHASIVSTGSTIKATNVGTYKVIIQLDDPSNYRWSDGTTENKEILWKILPKSISSFTADLGQTEFIYDGEEKKPSITLQDENYTLNSEEYTVDYQNNIIAGNASVTITGVGNYKDTINRSYIINPKIVTVNYIQGTGINNISGGTSSCEIKGTSTNPLQTTCSITLPTITLDTNYKDAGWFSNNTLIGSGGDEYSISDNISLTSMATKVVTVTFYRNGAKKIGGSTNDTQKLTCDILPNNSTCNITSLSIEGNDNTPDVIGWGITANSHSNDWQVNNSKAFSSDTSYYAQTMKEAKEITIRFNRNNAASISGKDYSLDRKCTISASYNGASQATSCKITSPSIVGSSNTPKVKGWSTTQDGHNNNWTPELERDTSANGTYYAQTYSEEKEINISYSTGYGVSSIGKTSDSCVIASSWNGNSQGTSCNVTLPSINKNTNYIVLGWYNGNTKVGDANSSYSISAATSLTARAGYDKTKLSTYCKTLTYNGNSQTLTNTPPTGISFTSNTGIDAKEYTVTASRNGIDYWSDGTTSSQTFKCSIGKKTCAVRLNISESEFYIGNSVNVWVYDAGICPVTATSSNSTIATSEVSVVDNGTKVVVTGQKNGSATITVSAGANNSNFVPASATFKGTVQKRTCNLTLGDTSGTVNAGKTTVTSGNTTTFSATSSDCNIAVSSSNTGRATASYTNGNVTATSVVGASSGTITITVTASKDNYNSTSKTYSLNVKSCDWTDTTQTEVNTTSCATSMPTSPNENDFYWKQTATETQDHSYTLYVCNGNLTCVISPVKTENHPASSSSQNEADARSSCNNQLSTYASQCSGTKYTTDCGCTATEIQAGSTTLYTCKKQIYVCN